MEMALQGWQQLELALSEKEAEAWGAVQHSLGLAYQDRVVGDDADKNRRAIWHFNQSLAVYDHTRFPGQWAKTHHKLAISLLALERSQATGAPVGHLDEQRRLGLLAFALASATSSQQSGAGGVAKATGSTAPSASQEHRTRSPYVYSAIGHLELALQVYAVEHKADNLWRVHLDLASAYLLCSSSDGMATIDRAIMYFEATLRSPGFTRESQPHQWAAVNQAMAAALLQRRPASEEQRLGNLDKAIEHYLSVLDVQRVLGASEAWAATHRAIADAWIAMVSAPARALHAGDNALFHYSEVLQVLTRASHALEYARTHRLMARACFAIASISPVVMQQPGAVTGAASADKRQVMISRMFEHYNTSLEVITKEHNPEEWTSLHMEVAERLANMLPDFKRRTHVESSIGHYQQALEVLNASYHPQQFAQAKAGLGAALGERKSACRGHDLSNALKCFREALSAVNKTSQPDEWARIQFQTAECLVSREYGDRNQNLEEATQACSAALSIFTAENNPEMWARAQGTMGWIYSSKTTGDRAQNTQNSIAHHWQALRVLTRSERPALWAATHIHLAEAYISRELGDRKWNIEQTMLHCRQALEVYQPDSHGLARAKCYDLLARAHGQREEGNRGDEVELCIVYWQLALKGFGRRAQASQWARIQVSLV